jgi:Icc-related predicted phosphoesterase
LEFNADITVKNAGADVLILSGDICVAEHLYRNPLSLKRPDGSVVDTSKMINNGGYSNHARRYREFFHSVSMEFDTVLYVMGNHEPYSGQWDRTEQILRDELVAYPNIHLLEQSRQVIGDVVFLGATLWTDLNNCDPITMHAVRDLMSDYQAITEIVEGRYRKLRPETTVKENRATVQWLNYMLASDQRKTVFLGHHTPSRRSIHPRYATQTLMNGAFCNELDGMIEQHDHLVLWTHGHVHNAWDYQIGNTRVVCNPYGYPDEEKEYDPNFVVEI